MAQSLGLRCQVFLFHNLQGTDRDGTSQGVTTIGRTVGARLNNQHDLLAAKNTANGIQTSRDSLAESDDIGLDVGPLGTTHASSSADASLDLVTNKLYLMLLAEGLDLGKVVLIGYDNSSLALDGLANKGSGLLAVSLQHLLKIGDVVVSDGLVSRGANGTKVR